MKGLVGSAVILALSSTVQAQTPASTEQVIQVQFMQTEQEFRLKSASGKSEMVFSCPGTLSVLKEDGAQGWGAHLSSQGFLLIDYPSGNLAMKEGVTNAPLSPHDLRLSCQEGRLSVETGAGLQLVVEPR